MVLKCWMPLTTPLCCFILKCSAVRWSVNTGLTWPSTGPVSCFIIYTVIFIQSSGKLVFLTCCFLLFSRRRSEGGSSDERMLFLLLNHPSISTEKTVFSSLCLQRNLVPADDSITLPQPEVFRNYIHVHDRMLLSCLYWFSRSVDTASEPDSWFGQWTAHFWTVLILLSLMVFYGLLLLHLCIVTEVLINYHGCTVQHSSLISAPLDRWPSILTVHRLYWPAADYFDNSIVHRRATSDSDAPVVVSMHRLANARRRSCECALVTHGAHNIVLCRSLT